MTTVDVDAILDDLKHAHDETVGATAITMSLLVYVDNPQVVDLVRDRSHRVVDKLPARLVLLDATLDPSSHDVQALHATVNNRTFTRAELVHIGARGLAAEQTGSVAHTFAVQGVPAVLFWAGQKILDDPNFKALTDESNALVFDSSRAQDGTATLREVAEYFAQNQPQAVQDLAYLRIGGWQELIAQFFDDPELVSLLGDLRSIRITAGSDAEALYILGWLASRLNWNVVGGDAFTDATGKRVTYHIERKGNPRRVYEIALQSGDSTFRASVVDESASTVRSVVEGTHARAPRTDALQAWLLPELVERAILKTSTTEAYRETIAAVHEILNATT